jgi:hypothetical protein
MTDEPHVGQVQDDLDRSVRHQGQGEREHRPLVNVSVSSSVDALRWKISSAVYWMEAGIHGEAVYVRIVVLPAQVRVERFPGAPPHAFAGSPKATREG